MAVEDRGPEFAALLITLLVLVTITIIGRAITAKFLLKRVFVEDWLALVTWIFYVIYTAFCLRSIHWGLGKHVGDVPLSHHPKALLYKWLGQAFYIIVAVLVKFVVGLLLLRICSHDKKQRWTIFILLAIVVLFNAFLLFIFMFQCQPVQFYWFRYTPDSHITGKCNKKKLAIIPPYISLCLNVVSDWTLALSPVSFVWNSNMDRRTKISVCGILALGIFASMATVARIPYARQLLNNPDYLYNFTDLAIWSTVEIGLGLSASSMATLKPLFRKLKILSSTRNASRLTLDTGDTPHSRNKSTGPHSRSRSLGLFAPRAFVEIRHGSTDNILENGGGMGKENKDGMDGTELKNITAKSTMSVENKKQYGYGAGRAV